MNNIFLNNLKALRGEHKKADFARKLGLSAPVYQRYEDGRMPRADVLSDIAKRLNLTVEQLISEPMSLTRETRGDQACKVLACEAADRTDPTSLTRETRGAASSCRYPEGCDLEAELGKVKERLAAMECQLDTVIRLLGASLHVGDKPHSVRQAG